MLEIRMDRLSRPWLAPWIHEKPGIAWCASWFAIPAILAFVFAVLPDTGGVTRVFLLLLGGLHAFAALGLLRGLKPAWHIAAFLAFVTIITRVVAVSCAPGNIADGDMHLLEAALDMIVLAVAVLIFTYLRKPSVRTLFNVPENYRISSQTPE